MSSWLTKRLHGFVPHSVWPATVLESPLLPMVMPRGFRGWLVRWELLLPFVVPVVYGLLMFLPGWDFGEQLMMVALGVLLVPFFFGFFIGLSAAIHIRGFLSRLEIEQLVVTRLRHGEIVQALTLVPAGVSRAAITVHFLMPIAVAVSWLHSNPFTETIVAIAIVAVITLGMLLFTRIISDNYVLLAAYQQLTVKSVVAAHVGSVHPGGVMLLLGAGVSVAAVVLQSDLVVAYGSVLLFLFLLAYSGNTPPALLVLKDLDGHPEQWWVHGEE